MPYLWLLVTSLFCLPALAAEHPHEHAREQHQAHVHGEAELMLAVDGQMLELELISPAMNIVGFEHTPATPAQIEAVHQAVARLQEADSLFQLPPAAGCRLVDAEVETGLMATAGQHAHEGHPAESHEHQGHQDERDGHAEFHAHYRYRCGKPEALDSMGVRLFEAFPGLHRLHAQTVSAHGQHQAELDKQHPHLPL
jgi:hypothetical protein